MKDKMQIEVKTGEDAAKAFQDMMERFASGESVLEGMEYHGFPDDDVVMTVRWADESVSFERGPVMDDFDTSDLRQLAMVMVKQAAMLIDMADLYDKEQDEARGE